MPHLKLQAAPMWFCLSFHLSVGCLIELPESNLWAASPPEPLARIQNKKQKKTKLLYSGDLQFLVNWFSTRSWRMGFMFWPAGWGHGYLDQFSSIVGLGTTSRGALVSPELHPAMLRGPSSGGNQTMAGCMPDMYPNHCPISLCLKSHSYLI